MSADPSTEPQPPGDPGDLGETTGFNTSGPGGAGHPPPDDGLVAAVLEELAVLAVRRISTPREISLTAAATLSHLRRHGATRLTALASEQGVSQPSMTQLVKRLEREGLLRRSADPQDGRAVQVTITDAGLNLLDERRRRRTERLAELIEELPAGERRELAAAAETLLPLLRRFTRP